MDIGGALFTYFWRFRPEFWGQSYQVELNGTSSTFTIDNADQAWYFAERGGGPGGEKEVLRKFIEVVETDDTVWDVGANLGLYTCFSQQITTEGQTISFEPHPSFRRYLEENIERNGGGSTIIPNAVSSENESVIISPVSNGGFGMVEEGQPSDIQGTRVEAKRPDTLISEGLTSPTVLKIDVEGAEKQVVDGLESFLDKVHTIFVEVHPERLPEFGTSESELKQQLENSGFYVQIIHRRGPDNYHWLCKRSPPS